MSHPKASRHFGMIGIATAVALTASATFSCGSERTFDDPDAPQGGSPGDGTDATASGGATTDTGSAGKGGAGGDASSSDPDSCEQDADCIVSGECRISYEDKDGDGYGNPDVSTGRCDGTVPAGYSTTATDCCDDGGNLELAAKINPGQETYFDTTANICGIAWDYDCSGEVELGGYSCSGTTDCEGEMSPLVNPTIFEGCGDPPECDEETRPVTADYCGDTYNPTGSCSYTGSVGDSCVSNGQSVTTFVHCH